MKTVAKHWWQNDNASKRASIDRRDGIDFIGESSIGGSKIDIARVSSPGQRRPSLEPHSGVNKNSFKKNLDVSMKEVMSPTTPMGTSGIRVKHGSIVSPKANSKERSSPNNFSPMADKGPTSKTSNPRSSGIKVQGKNATDVMSESFDDNFDDDFDEDDGGDFDSIESEVPSEKPAKNDPNRYMKESNDDFGKSSGLDSSSHIKKPVEAVVIEDYNTFDMNKLTYEQANLEKAKMQDAMSKNFIGKGHADFKYDKQENFEAADDTDNSWDEEEDD